MNSYQYKIDEAMRPYIIEKFGLNKPIITSLVIAIGVPIIMFIIIANMIPGNQGMAIFVLLGTMIGLGLNIRKRNNIIKKILKADQVKWDDKKIIFLQNGDFLAEWSRESIKVVGTSSSALYLVSGKNSLKLEHMVIAITVDSPDDIKDLARSLISTSK